MGDGQVLTATGWALYSPLTGSLYLLVAFLTAQLPKVASQMAIPSHPGTGVAAEGKQTLCSKGTLYHMDRRNTFRHSAHQCSAVILK